MPLPFHTFLRALPVAFLLLCTGCLPAWAQIPVLTTDKQALENVKLAMEKIYAFEFDQTDTYLKRLKPKYNNHPVIGLVTALNMYWKYLPVSEYPEEYIEYKKLLNTVSDQSNKMLEKDPNNAEGTFFQMMAMMMLAKHESDAGEYGHAINHASKAYRNIQKGFGMKSRYPEFYFTCGVYDYYRVLYPELNPFYGPLMGLFAAGSKANGLAELKIAGEKSVFTGTEAYIYLARITLYHEMKPAEALEFAKAIRAENPKNTYIASLTSECLVAARQYEEAEKTVAGIRDMANPFYRVMGEALQGMIYEKGEKNTAQARTWYLKALETSKKVKKNGGHAAGLSYAGLARLADAAGEKDKAMSYYKKAFDLCQWQSIRNEAKAYNFDENPNKVKKQNAKAAKAEAKAAKKAAK
ncbi:MAG: tetratricopeptide repeat protein [Bacteroidota bacterium]